MSTEESNKSSVNTEKTLKKPFPAKPFKKGHDPRRNLKGNPGAQHFNTLYKRTIATIAKEFKLTPEQLDEKVMKKAVEQMLRGNYSYFKDIMDRRFGKAIETFKVEGGDEPIRIESSIGKKLGLEYNEKLKAAIREEIRKEKEK